ncbi:MAG: RNA methyltransferase [Candidatus Margulisbacteria bacterium]|jgi:TrmH family RNA methyltransferase|nr:RNA methyltransferase [Candidatus Margulisiibacteriota bacterium]
MLDSARNPLIRSTLKLHDKKGRIDAGCFLIEGRRELDLAVKHGVELKKILYCPDIISDVEKYPGEKTAVSAQILAKISYRGGTEGFVAVAQTPRLDLMAWPAPPEPLIVVLDKLEKPGNIGAVLRTACAAAVDAVFVCDSAGDPYNPNLIRASLGAVFALPVFWLSAAETLRWLAARKIKIAAASPYARQTHWQHGWTGAQAVVIGNEAAGLTEIWQKSADARILIPMSGGVDSLNASVSAAVLIYEAARQRRSPNFAGEVK